MDSSCGGAKAGKYSLKVKTEPPTVRAFHSFLLAAASLLPAACATSPAGTSQGITLLTDPPGAACDLRRGGDLIAMTGQTPVVLQVDRSAQDIEVRCTHAGHQPVAAVIKPFRPDGSEGIAMAGPDAPALVRPRYPSVASLRLVRAAETVHDAAATASAAAAAAPPRATLTAAEAAALRRPVRPMMRETRVNLSTR
jgi:hypothetical protein